MNEQESLIQNLSRNWDSPAKELAEITLDHLLKDELIKDIPIVSSLIGFYKTGIGIRDYIFLRKLHKFLKNYHIERQDIEYEYFKTKLMTINATDLYEHLITILDKIDYDIKVNYLNNLFDAFINGNINYERFIDLSLLINSLHPKGFIILENLALSNNPFRLSITHSDSSEISLLTMGGLLNTFSVWGGTALEVNTLGKDLYKYGMVKDE